MNALDRAKNRMKNGWCTSTLYKDGKYCSVGALAVELDPQNRLLSGFESGDAYKTVASSKEGKILAETIVENFLSDTVTRNILEYGLPLMCDDTIAWIIYYFNDGQDSFDNIEQAFEKASAKFEEQA